MSQPRYADPGALRQAIADRLRHVARDRPGAQLSDLQRQFAYDRLLARVFSTEPEAWVLKGATALLARLHGSARHTLDIDLCRPGAGLDRAEAALRAAASTDLGDYFRFTLEPGRRIAEGRATLRVPVTAYLGATVFARFHVDLVSGVLMTGEPDDVSPLVPVELPGIMRVRYRAYPIVDHIADKVCALVELHPRADWPPQASTRYRDLADLAVIAHTQPVHATALRTALTSESGRRGIELPTALSSPAAPGWRTGYARVAKDVPDLAERDFEAALGDGEAVPRSSPRRDRHRELEAGPSGLGLTNRVGRPRSATRRGGPVVQPDSDRPHRRGDRWLPVLPPVLRCLPVPRLGHAGRLGVTTCS